VNDKNRRVPVDIDKFDFNLRGYYPEDDSASNDGVYNDYLTCRLKLFMKTGCRKSVLGDYIYIHAQDLRDTLDKYKDHWDESWTYMIRTIEAALENKTDFGEKYVGFPLPNKWWFFYPELLNLIEK